MTLPSNTGAPNAGRKQDLPKASPAAPIHPELDADKCDLCGEHLLNIGEFLGICPNWRKHREINILTPPNPKVQP